LTPIDPDTRPLSVGVFLLLRDLIRDRLGIWFDENKRELLASKVSDRIKDLGLRSFLNYFYLLKYGPREDEEWEWLTDALSVQETYFWREFSQIEALVAVLVPQHQAAGLGPIRIWCAACATGEEPLTIAMALSEARWFDRADIELWASDISPAALEKASRGFYRERSFRSLPAMLRSRYFTPAEGGWQVDPALHARVRFTRANLLDEKDTANLATARYTFCRNVFIYFSPATIGQVVGRFAERMPRPGYLFVGASESLLRTQSTFELEEIGGAFVYVNR
jgi:chemotaxis protein methyltransferase CheR